ncbi:hypothetical protein [Arthrobacter sp. Soil763]|uniref:hypothetical protein n=1 Tax=Arthrobacter sp. Soil763 TaxID=1736402 RepID=UPI0006FF6C20|nr:hypothetical protein [Arthrobacter sp. Soil763]KRE78408.1 hypothetical protein ASG71_11045 [Arthrobacter sp. Soil763]
MPQTAGQKLGSLLLPLYLLAVLAGMATGAAVGAVLSAISALQRVLDPVLASTWGPGGPGIIPILVGVPVGAGMALAPATGAVAGLFVQAWKLPFPSVRSQARAAAWGAGLASVLLTCGALLMDGANVPAIVAAGAAYALGSWYLASAITSRLLRHRESRESRDATD